MDRTVGILGCDLDAVTRFFENIINNTKGSTDQDHIKLNIVADSRLLEKNAEELAELAREFKDSGAELFILAASRGFYDAFKKVTDIPIMNSAFDPDDIELVRSVISFAGGEVRL